MELRARLAFALALVLPLMGMSCSAGDTTVRSSAATSTSAISIALSVGALVPDFSPDVHEYELTSFTTLSDVLLTVEGRAAHVLDVDTVPSVAQLLPRMAIAEGANLVVTVDGAAGETPATYTIRLRPADFPAFTVKTDAPEPGEILLTPFPFLGKVPQPYLLIVDTAGNVLYYLRKPDENATDLKRHVLPDGSVRMTYLSAGMAHLLDEHMTPIRDYRILATPRHPENDAGNHDIVVLGPDHVIIEGYLKETVTNIPEDLDRTEGGSPVYASVIQEIEDGKVLFDWASTDHPELYALSTASNDFTKDTYADYSHLNSVSLDPANGNLVVSFRNLDCVLELSRADGSIVWRLGGEDDSFGTTEEQRSSHQHFASFLADGRLMLYDNGNARSASRILTYGLDVANHKVTSFEQQPLDGYFSEFMGSTQPVGKGSLLVGLGSNPPGTPDIILFDRASGRHTFELRFGADDYYSYRAHWAD